jgi:predicted TPR repeat methyltransferase
MESAPCGPDDPVGEAERLIAAGRAHEAAQHLRSLLEQGRGGLLARLTFLKALTAAGETSEALAAAREVVHLYPDIAEAALGLGEVLLAAELLPTAIAEFQRALRLDPGLERARFLLGCAWLDAGEADRALEAFSEVSSETPGAFDKVAQAQAMRARPRSDPGYVRHLFDQFSADYDKRMVESLSYRAPQILRQLADLILPGRTGLAVLDLGCGTGLCGAAFRDIAARLDGIDLSPAMIAKAQARAIYDLLAVADLEEGMAAHTYDVVLAADTVVYLGELGPAMQAVARALKPGGSFLFTAEAKDGDGFELGPKRRWRHSQTYLREAAAAHGFFVAGLMSCAPRMEANTPVAGFAVALRRPD